MHYPVNGPLAPIPVDGRVKLRQQGHFTTLRLQLKCNLEGKNTAFAHAAEKIGAPRLDGEDVLQEASGQARERRVERVPGVKPLLLQGKHV